jgi:tetratricopeptide (TPR) repeat protein
MYDNLVNKFQFGNMHDPNVYLDETNMRMTMNLRNNYYRLADALIKEGKYDSANVVIDHCLEAMPDKSVPFNYFTMPLAEGYYKTGEIEKGNQIANRLIEIFDEQLAYYFEFPDKLKKKYDFEKQQNLALLQKMGQVAGRYKQEEVDSKASEIFDVYFNMYNEE